MDETQTIKIPLRYVGLFIIGILLVGLILSTVNANADDDRRERCQSQLDRCYRACYDNCMEEEGSTWQECLRRCLDEQEYECLQTYWDCRTFDYPMRYMYLEDALE